MKRKAAFLFLAVMMITQCGNITGEFAVRGPYDDAYKRLSRPLELSSDEVLRWIYRFDSTPGNTTIAIITRRLALVPVDLNTRMEILESGERILYGTIENLAPGKYEILLVESRERTLIDTLSFTVYSE